MLFTTMYGSYLGEDGRRDAWNGMFESLARRAARWTAQQRKILRGN